jgi:4-hydroxy-tetrahydrodipicolinate synthase
MFEGVSVAIVTPFRDGRLDEPALRGVLRHVLDQGVQGIVATGSTGESPTLSAEERERVWAVTVEETRGKAFALAGTGTNDTRSTVALTRRAAELGVDGCMVVTPYYNKPTPAGLLAHFRAAADASSVPLMLYNVPGRTGCNLLPRTVEALAAHPRIVAIKEASGSVEQATEILRATPLTVLSGEDALTLPLVAAGARGVVSVAAHVAGREFVALLEDTRSGRLPAAGERHRKLAPLIRALFLESNPAPVKAALAWLGLLRDELRLPLVPVEPGTREAVIRELKALGLREG